MKALKTFPIPVHPYTLEVLRHLPGTTQVKAIPASKFDRLKDAPDSLYTPINKCTVIDTWTYAVISPPYLYVELQAPCKLWYPFRIELPMHYFYPLSMEKMAHEH